MKRQVVSSRFTRVQCRWRGRVIDGGACRELASADPHYRRDPAFCAQRVREIRDRAAGCDLGSFSRCGVRCEQTFRFVGITERPSLLHGRGSLDARPNVRRVVQQRPIRRARPNVRARSGLHVVLDFGPGERLKGAARDRGSLVGYFIQRHAHGERLRLTSFKVTTSRRRRQSAAWVGFQYSLIRSADGLPPTRYLGKGAAFCSFTPHTIAVWSMGPAYVEQPEVSRERFVEIAASNVLSTVQDVITEDSAQPWPATEAGLPMPETEIEHGVLHMWFGVRTQPEFELEPISIPSSGSADNTA